MLNASDQELAAKMRTLSMDVRRPGLAYVLRAGMDLRKLLGIWVYTYHVLWPL